MVAMRVAACGLMSRDRRLGAAAMDPGGRTPQRGVVPARFGAAGTQSPWQLGSHPGSNLRGS